MSWSIKVSEDTWCRLNARKQPGDSFEDVIERLLNESQADADSLAAEQ